MALQVDRRKDSGPQKGANEQKEGGAEDEVKDGEDDFKDQVFMSEGVRGIAQFEVY